MGGGLVVLAPNPSKVKEVYDSPQSGTETLRDP